MDHVSIIRDIRAGQLSSVYSLMGEEPYFIDQICEVLENEVLSEAEKAFNLTVVYGRDVSMDALIQTAKGFPMMGERQVIIVREAQAMDDWRRSANLEALQHYLTQPQPATVLVFAYKGKKMDGRSKAVQTLKKTGVWFESKQLKEGRIPAWVRSYLESYDYRVSDKAAHLLAEFLGTQLSKLKGELDKLMIVVPKGEEITPDHIERNIGISKDYNIFELQKAIGTKNIERTNRIINHFLANPKVYPIQMVLPMLYSYFSKLLVLSKLTDKSSRSVSSALKISPYGADDYLQAHRNYSFDKLTRILGYLRDMDRKSKGLDVDKMEVDPLLREMIFKVMH